MKCYNRNCKYNNQGDINSCTKASIVLDREGKCLDFCPLNYTRIKYQPDIKTLIHDMELELKDHNPLISYN